MEPDHSAGIFEFMKAFPKATVVSSAKAFAMMQGFFGTDFADRRIVVGEGDTLSLGKHTLTFVAAPMVHWPEVVLSYDSFNKVLFSADAFGKFGALDAEEEWLSEARRYYIGIVAKYGAQVQSVLKKAAALEIAMICPLHGPVLKENLSYYLDLYDAWSSYRPEKEGIVIAYTSVYGNTKKAAIELSQVLSEKGAAEVKLFDLARSDMAEAVAAAFAYPKLVLATTTYNGDVFPPMHTFLHALAERGFRDRTVGLIENGSWAPIAAKKMKEALQNCKNLSFAENEVRIVSALNEESRKAICNLAEEICRASR
jgi:flavorubredoxin